VKTVVLKMYIHCEGCASDVKKKIEKMEGTIMLIKKHLQVVPVRKGVSKHTVLKKN